MSEMNRIMRKIRMIWYMVVTEEPLRLALPVCEMMMRQICTARTT